MASLAANGIAALARPTRRTARAIGPRWQGDGYSGMRNLRSSELGAGLYQRPPVDGEAAFGHATRNPWIDRFPKTRTPPQREPSCA